MVRGNIQLHPDKDVRQLERSKTIDKGLFDEGLFDKPFILVQIPLGHLADLLSLRLVGVVGARIDVRSSYRGLT